MAESAYHLAIDTGGTFTDCMAYTPDRGVLRCKVLSHGALRVRIVRRISPMSFEIAQSWAATRDIFALWIDKPDPLCEQVIELDGPYGLKGGEDGCPGRQYLMLPNGTERAFQDGQSMHVKPGTRLVVKTPGGGGWGKVPG